MSAQTSRFARSRSPSPIPTITSPVESVQGKMGGDVLAIVGDKLLNSAFPLHGVPVLLPVVRLSRQIAHRRQAPRRAEIVHAPQDDLIRETAFERGQPKRAARELTALLQDRRKALR